MVQTQESRAQSPYEAVKLMIMPLAPDAQIVYRGAKVRAICEHFGSAALIYHHFMMVKENLNSPLISAVVQDENTTVIFLRVWVMRERLKSEGIPVRYLSNRGQFYTWTRKGKRVQFRPHRDGWNLQIAYRVDDVWVIRHEFWLNIEELIQIIREITT